MGAGARHFIEKLYKLNLSSRYWHCLLCLIKCRENVYLCKSLWRTVNLCKLSHNNKIKCLQHYIFECVILIKRETFTLPLTFETKREGSKARVTARGSFVCKTSCISISFIFMAILNHIIIFIQYHLWCFLVRGFLSPTPLASGARQYFTWIEFLCDQLKVYVKLGFPHPHHQCGIHPPIRQLGQYSTPLKF